jgi:GntR family transcriptional repressor for pyruvate dehydrogenase complex
MSKPAKPKEINNGSANAAPDEFAALIESGKQKTEAAKKFGGVLERKSISEQVANRIMAMIKSGNLKSGDRLPTEQQMCIAFGISRPPLREALKALTLMGVLSSRQGGRYTITDLSPSRLVAPFNVMLSANNYDVQVHFEARAVVDLELVRLCTERANSETRDRILTLAREGHAFYDDPVAFRLLDIEFHQAINIGGGNPLLSALAESLYDVALDIRRIASTVPGVIEISVNQHCDVADAIIANDATAAVSAYRVHLEHIRNTTIQATEAAKN